MTDLTDNMLSMFQHADSMFPSGAVSFSWGLETLSNCGIIGDKDQLAQFIELQINERWANLDRVMVFHAHNQADDVARLARLDRLVEAQTLSTEQREGSRRMGSAMLAVHLRLGTSNAQAYETEIRAGTAFGHLPVVQGTLWQACGFSADQALMMSAHGLLTNLLGAAIRLSVIGHLDAQSIHARLVPAIQSAMARPMVAPDNCCNFAPQIEIASMLHETDDMRLFMN